jgi:intracellular septation protein
MQKNHHSFFLISFLPAIAYWYLEEHYTLKIALAGGVILGVVEMILERVFTGRVHKMSQLNFLLLSFLGGLSFLGESGIWFKLQPFFLCAFFSIMFISKLLKKESLIHDLSKDMGRNLPINKDLLLILEWRLTYYFIFYALLMLILAFFASTSIWAMAKTAGFYISFFIYFIFSFMSLKRKMERA